jgi:hypothetical protein
MECGSFTSFVLLVGAKHPLWTGSENLHDDAEDSPAVSPEDPVKAES